jgi:hypothetical protein
MKPQLIIDDLIREAKSYCALESQKVNTSLFGVTDGKAVGTYIEHSFQEYSSEKYEYVRGSSASGIDLPDEHISTDIKVTSITQPQSSCPFRSARQKIYGLGYNLLLFVYDKTDNPTSKSTRLNLLHCSFIDKSRTADYQTTFALRQMLDNGANAEELAAFLADRNLPVDEIGMKNLVEEILAHPPLQGYLTISNALQWRLQYSRIVQLQSPVDGIIPIVQQESR